MLYGEQGTWKSSKALEFLKFKNENGKPFRVLYIDAEQGSVDTYLDEYEAEGYDLQNIYIVYTQSLSEVKEFIYRARNNEDFYLFDNETGQETDEVYLDSDGQPFRPDAIVVDGVTLLYIAKEQSYLEFSRKRATVRAKKNELTGMEKDVSIEGAGIEIKDYKSLKFDGQDLILDLLASGKHYCVTCREEDEKEQFKDKDGSIKMMATGRKQPSGFKDLRYNVKTVIHLFKDDDGIIKGVIENKDRTKIHRQDEVIEEPTLLDWQLAIDKNKNKQSVVVDNNLHQSVEVERKAIEKQNAKFEDDMDNEKEEEQKQLKTPEDYQDKIDSTLRSIKDATEKAKLKTAIADAGLPNKYRSLKDIKKLKQYLDIVTGK